MICQKRIIDKERIEIKEGETEKEKGRGREIKARILNTFFSPE